MNALILAAGFGSRLLPHTRTLPKPLFSIGGRTFIDGIIENLGRAGISRIRINTHHLHGKIKAHIQSRSFPMPVSVAHEPELLGTGGAIKNAAAFFKGAPFMAINADIVTDINLARVFEFHMGHPHPVTLALHDRAEFNKVVTDGQGFVTGFDGAASPKSLAFSGIQVVDGDVADFIPAPGFSNIIDIYKKMIEQGVKIRAFVSENHFWSDIGTPESYKMTAFDQLAPLAFERAGFPRPKGRIRPIHLAGDGSDRTWSRWVSGGHSIIAVDHGIRKSEAVAEIDSVAAIGAHLRRKHLPVPEIYLHDAFSGLAFMEDFGDEHLESHVKGLGDSNRVFSCYEKIIRRLVDMSVSGADGFDPSMAHQTPVYDQAMIMEKECRYFLDAFLNPRLPEPVDFDFFRKEFEALSDRAVAFGFTGFMHRDFQSRNIMVKNRDFYFIDFQGGRMGPIQYDMASLLIDPYVGLPDEMQRRLAAVCFKFLSKVAPVDETSFFSGYEYCAITRNLQMLGAFAHLSEVKGKTRFAQYIPPALQTLWKNLGRRDFPEFPKLKAAVGFVLEKK